MLEIVPVSLKEANAFVEQHHRHHKPVAGHKFSIGCAKIEGGEIGDGKIVGVAIVGRPVSRYLDDGWTLEVNRLCTDGEKNACSMLYAAAWRAAKAMGYKKLITYILDTEPGTSLKAAGWKCVGKAGGLQWTGKRKPEVDLYPQQMKLKWEIGGEKMNSKELIRRALLGDQEAQQECTEKGIVLPCWRCGGESEIQELHTGGKPIYAVTCKKTYCGAYGCACSTQQKAIEYWNTRPAPPIGRCGECKFYTALGHCKVHSQEPDQYGSGAYVEMLPDDFCSYFEPKEE